MSDNYADTVGNTSRPTGLDYTRLAQQAQGIAGQQLNARPVPIRERLQEAAQQAATIRASLMSLVGAIVPPLPIGNAAGATEHLKDSTLSSDMDDLRRILAQIEQDVARLSAAICG